jgi:hypothetical protein
MAEVVAVADLVAVALAVALAVARACQTETMPPSKPCAGEPPASSRPRFSMPRPAPPKEMLKDGLGGAICCMSPKPGPPPGPSVVP